MKTEYWISYVKLEKNLDDEDYTVPYYTSQGRFCGGQSLESAERHYQAMLDDPAYIRIRVYCETIQSRVLNEIDRAPKITELFNNPL